MKKTVIVLLLVAVFGLVPEAGNALKWNVSASVLVTELVRADPEPSWVRARSFHRLVVNHRTTADLLIPFTIQVTQGILEFSQGSSNFCNTGWAWGNSVQVLTCRLSRNQDPCADGFWTGLTEGRVQFHPQGGYKTKLSRPQPIICCT